MAKKEKTSPGMASKAAKALNDPKTSKTTKSIAGSVLSQAKSDKVTSKSVASKAAKVLGNDKAGKVSKAVAGSALTQKPAASKSTSSTGPRRR